MAAVKRKNHDFEKPIELSSYLEFLKALKGKSLTALNPVLKQKILSKLVEKVELLPDGMKVHFYVGASKIKRELDKTGSLLLNAVRCSNSLTIGGRYLFSVKSYSYLIK